ncbi:hypothetical protein I79_013124 [Cricetulus griseus]|uniref:Uncharacterized protein n=1 Tax=Cricetulus griseus TaxID=10029 RepID=G3HQL9_CRIGR|nr:hypothetical protein I79_013124 [Cricetulus griseus]
MDQSFTMFESSEATGAHISMASCYTNALAVLTLHELITPKPHKSAKGIFQSLVP